VRVQVWHPNIEIREDAVELVRDGEVFALNFDLRTR
jgi:hypothetical protein